MAGKKEGETKVKANSFGAAGFTLAVSSIVILLFGVLGIIVMPIIGFIFCFIQQKKKPTKLGKVGLIVSVIAVVLFLIYFLWLGPIITEYLQNYSTI